MSPRDERGLIVVTTVLVLVAALALGGVAVTAGVRAHDGQRRDVDVKRALQAADAGVQSQLYRINQLNLASVNLTGGLNGLGNTLVCPFIALDAEREITTQVASVAYDASAGDCPTPPSGDPTATATEPLGDGASTTATWHEPARSNGGSVSFSGGYIMATGVADGERRRVKAELHDVEPLRTVDALGALELRADLTHDDLAVVVNGDLRSNKTIALTGSGLKVVAAAPGVTSGTITHRTGFTQEGRLNLALGAVRQLDEPFRRNAIDLPAGKPDCPATGCPAGYSSVTRSYKRDSGGRVSFPAGDYVFCSFSLKETGKIEIPLLGAGAVRIFVDPSRCPSADYAGRGSFVVETGTPGGLLGLGYDPNPDPIRNLNAASASSLQVYLLGTDAPTETKLSFRPTVTAGTSLLGLLDVLASVNPMPAVFYAPRSNVHVQNATILGTITGHDVLLQGRTIVSFDPNVLSIPLTNSAGTFSVKRYVECAPQAPAPGEPPDAGC
jgi:Tfp pilus assembly protein PilX